MDDLLIVLAVFFVVQLIVFAAFSVRIKELEDRIKQLDWQQEQLLMWYMHTKTTEGVDQAQIERVDYLEGLNE